MCVIDVRLFTCDHFTAHTRGLHCPSAVDSKPCSRPDVASIVTRDRTCFNCLYSLTLNTILSIYESMVRWERKCLADAEVWNIEWARPKPEIIEEHEKTIADTKKKLEAMREAQKFPVQDIGGTQLSSRNQFLSIIKFQAQEMHSILLADDD